MSELVLYIEKEKFLRQLLEGVFKAKNAKIHTEDGIQDKFYLIEDLKPSIIIVDLETVNENEIQTLYSYQSIKLIATAKNEYPHIDMTKFSKIIKKPLVVATIFEQIFSNN